ncbi:hypothetical protein ACJX0J_036350, partial [Zea mays]
MPTFTTDLPLNGRNTITISGPIIAFIIDRSLDDWQLIAGLAFWQEKKEIVEVAG